MSSAAAKRSRGVRVLGLGFALLFVLLCVAALIAYRWQGTPTHWTEQQERIAALTGQEREAISVSMRNRLLTAWSDAGEKTPTRPEDLYGHRAAITIAYDELNIWIAEEGISLLEEVGVKMPKSVKSAMVDSPGQGHLRISFDFDTGTAQQIVALSFDIRVVPDGTVTSTLQSATVGRLPLPTQSAIDLITQQAGDNTELLDLMRGNPVPPVELPIDRSREGRLVGLEVTEDALIVTRETVRPSKK